MAAKRPSRGAAPEPEPEAVEAAPMEQAAPSSDAGLARLLIGVTTGSLLIAIVLVCTELKKYGAGPLG